MGTNGQNPIIQQAYLLNDAITRQTLLDSLLDRLHFVTEGDMFSKTLTMIEYLEKIILIAYLFTNNSRLNTVAIL